MQLINTKYFYSEGKVSIHRNPDACSAISVIFHILTGLSWPQLLIYCQKDRKFIDQVKKPAEIIELDFDFNKLHAKFITWYVKGKEPVLHLNARETENLKLSCNTAYYYYAIQGYQTISKDQKDSLVDIFYFLFELDF